MRKLFQNRRESIAYVAFGIITTAIGMPIYLGAFEVAEHFLSVDMADKTTAAYNTTYVLAQVIKWIVTVAITFFIHRKWVFHSRGPIRKQLLLFSSSRLVTFFLDLALTYGFILLFSLWLTPDNTPVFRGIKLSAELWAKLIVAILVIILNYIISKLIVFRKRKT